MLVQSTCVLQLRKEALERLLRLWLRARAFPDRELVHQPVWLERWLSRLEQELVARVPELLELEVQQPVRWLQHHRELQTTRERWRPKLLQAHVPRNLLLELERWKAWLDKLLDEDSSELTRLLECWLLEREPKA